MAAQRESEVGQKELGGCGSTPMGSHFGDLRCTTHFRTYFSARRVHTHPRVFCVSSVFVLEFSGSLTNVHLCGSLNIPVTNSFQSKAAHFLF